MIYSQDARPSPARPNHSKKASDAYPALDLRNPGGTTIAELQAKDAAGLIKNPYKPNEDLYEMDPALRRQRQLAGLLPTPLEQGKFTELEIQKLKECF